MPKKPKILVAPLDWGWGHTTRCIPIIAYLQELGAEVIFAGNPSQISFISQEIQGLECIQLEGYNIRYGRNSWQTIIRLSTAIPRLFIKVHKENLWLNQVIQEYQLDGVISDNRFGLYSNLVPTICITHQLNIQSPIGKKWVNILNHHYLRKFQKIWVLDEADHRYAGILSHNTGGLNATYLGILSRMKAVEKKPCTQECLLIMSGVSPAKEIFRDEVIAECKRVKKQLTIVGNDRVYQEPGIQSLAYQTTAQLQSLIADHHLIISRIGYTTIMDLCLMRKSALLVATPGQGEQEYLASYHKGKLFVIQENVDLSSAWKEIPAEIPLATEGYQHCIQEWLSGIKG